MLKIKPWRMDKDQKDTNIEDIWRWTKLLYDTPLYCPSFFHSFLCSVWLSTVCFVFTLMSLSLHPSLNEYSKQEWPYSWGSIHCVDVCFSLHLYPHLFFTMEVNFPKEELRGCSLMRRDLNRALNASDILISLSHDARVINFRGPHLHWRLSKLQGES